MSDIHVKVEVDENVRLQFGHLFGIKRVNGREISVEDTIGTLTAMFLPNLREALTERRRLLDSGEPVRRRYALPSMDEVFEDPVEGSRRSLRDILQGLVDNFLDRPTALSWRLNDMSPIPEEAHPLLKPGLELTGPWHPLDMAIKQINADVSAIMGPDDEDAAPADFIPYGSPEKAVGLFASRANEHLILSGGVKEVGVVKKGQTKTYRIEKPRDRWPTSFHRVPGIHLRTPYVKVNGEPAPSIVVDFVIHALNDYEPLRRVGSLLYFYVPKTQSPLEAWIVAKIVWELERLMGAGWPGEFVKFKALYEEANAGRYLPVIMWMWRYWLIGTNVGRWDYTASLIEMWKDERVLPDPQNGALMGMTSPHMMAYQRYNALLNLMAGLRGGQLTNAGAIGGMNAVMLYSALDPYMRGKHNPVTLRGMWMDKLRERLIGLIFVVDEPCGRPTLDQILAGKVKGRLYDVYRQSWVASPDQDYVAAGNMPLRAAVDELQAMLDAPEDWVDVDGRRVAPKTTSGLTGDERRLLSRLGLVDDKGKITPWVICKLDLDSPEKLLSTLWGGSLWDALYEVQGSEITVENVQHAFYMAANYGFQVLNGNLAAAIDDYVLFPGRVVRFMNDLATYRIFVGWLWTVFHSGAKTTRKGFLKRPALTGDGVMPAVDAFEVEVGTPLDRQLFEKIWSQHEEWTQRFFEEYDRTVAIRVAAAATLTAQSEDQQVLDRVVQVLVPNKTVSPEELTRLLGVPQEEAYRLLEALDHLNDLREAVSMAYGSPPHYVAQISLEDAARRLAQHLGADHKRILGVLEAHRPRFDRSKAPVIMDILRRQILCPRYIQHSARVLFVVADKNPEERDQILGAIYYLDGLGQPLYRGDHGQPDRQRIVDAVNRGETPISALEAHDYVYDVFP
jgi:malate synthase